MKEKPKTLEFISPEIIWTHLIQNSQGVSLKSGIELTQKLANHNRKLAIENIEGSHHVSK